MTRPPTSSSVVVVIPTRDRPDKVANAFASTLSQTIRPSLLTVVGHSDTDLRVLRQATRLHDANVPTEFLVNTRTSNLSGSLNTAICHLLELDRDPRNTYVAFLDDDDTWEHDYLSKCLEKALDEDLDWVVAGIVRHQEDGAANLSIPEWLTMSQFLHTNPHVQGSNLFVRLETLLKAGGFDENLQSTTDRDICIRMLALGDTKVGFIREHLVHHMASGGDRLSAPGLPAKRNGLLAFYRKYSPMMSREDRDRFLVRATTMFGCSLSDFSTQCAVTSST